MTYPKIELHLHLEGAVSPELLLQIARRNHVRLPVDDVDGLRRLYAFRDFAHFIEAYTLAMQVLRAERDFREVVVAYAEQAKAHGAVYIEAIFGPSDSVRAGASWDEVYSGYCDGAQAAWEEHGVQIALTPDIARQYSIEDAEFVGRYAAKYRDRGVVGLGLGGLEVGHPPEPFAEVFATARDSGLASLPHAGEVVGPASIRGALTALNADRIRHGIRAVDDPTLVTDLADRQLVLDVCPISNLRTGAVRSLDAHPLPHLFRAGVPCSLSTDDPAMFDTDLGREYANAVERWAISPREFYAAGVRGAVCDQATRERLARIGTAFDWSAVEPDGAHSNDPRQH
jgi:aminodeoxyfutalosine deaminase